MPCVRIKDGFVCESGEFKAGDLPPFGYLENQEWHEVQQRAGLRQVKCGKCGKYCYPQELSDKEIESKYCKTKHGPLITETKPICKECG